VDTGSPAPNGGSFGGSQRTPLVPALAAALVSVVLLRAGFLSFLFLVPLGVTAAWSPALGWLSGISAAVLNTALSLGLSLVFRSGPGPDIGYGAVLSLGFTWIMAGQGGETGFPRVRAVYRFIAASLAGAAVFLGIAWFFRGDDGFSGLIRAQAQALSSAYSAASEADAVRHSLAEQLLTPEKLLETITAIALRGGALAAACMLFFISRQISLALAGLFRKQGGGEQGKLAAFHAPANTIWALSLCLAAVLVTRRAGLEIPEIAAWNALLICVILFLAQGGGIVLYALARRPLAPAPRFLCTALMVVALCSPGLNMFVLGALVLLGIAENWLPLRRPEQNGSAPTPGL
jgi:hypothetical protein